MNSVEVRLTAELIVMAPPAVGSVATAKRVAGDVGGAREVGGPCEAPGNGRKLAYNGRTSACNRRKLAYNGRTSACNRRKLASDRSNFVEIGSFHASSAKTIRDKPSSFSSVASDRSSVASDRSSIASGRSSVVSEFSSIASGRSSVANDRSSAATKLSSIASDLAARSG
jgi:hypothetical protein